MNLKRPRNVLLILLGVVFIGYVAWVAHFEVRLGINQPTYQSHTLVITTTKADGSTHDRVLSRLQDGHHLYVAANHWPRAWYKQALENPKVKVTMDGETRDYLAVPMRGDKDEYMKERFPMSFRGRLKMGFPPRYFLRLDPLDQEN